MKHLRRCLAALAVFTLSTAFAGTTGRVNGFLKDGSGGGVVGGKITLVDKSKGTSFATTTDKKGAWAFPIVAPGEYTVHADAAGFVPQDKPVIVHVDSALKVELKLEAAAK